MAYDKFTVLRSTAVPLPIENVDTDQIIPARFLKATKREGLVTTFLEIGDITMTTRVRKILY
jgi:3-isopropylmalate dehydratase small subunit